MKTTLTFILLMLMVLTAGCNNPSGGSVVDRGHSPGLDKPGAFQFKTVHVKDGTANLSWSSSPRVASYALFMGTSSSAITTPVTCTSTLAVSCDVTGLVAGTTYYFSVTATNDAGSTKVRADVPALSVTSFDITSSSAGDAEIDLAWSTSTGATKYTVKYGTSSGSYSNSVTNVTSPYTLTGLQNGVRYYVRVVATNASNGYAESDSEINARPLGPPPAPTNLSISPTSTAATLDWDNVAGATSYKIYRGTSSGSYALIATVTTSSYADTGLTDGNTYYYALKANNGVFDSTSYSTEVPVKLIENFSATALTAAPAANQLTVSWPAVTGADSYNIQYGTSASSLTSTLSNQTSPAVISGLTGGTTYYVRVRAINAVGGGNVVNSTNTLSAAPIPAIAAPTGITIAATPGNIRIGWNSVSGATSYQVWRGTVSGTHASLVTGLTGNYYDDTVANGTAYYYVVKSFNGYPSVASSQVSAKAINNFSISSITSPSPTSLVVNWATPVDGADNFDLRYRTSSGSYTLVQNVSSGVTVSGLSPATTYFVYLTARNTVGSTTTSLASAEVSKTTALSPPSTVTLSATPGNVSVAWSTVTGASSYKVHRATTSGGPYTEIANSLTTSPYTDSSVTDGTTYYYVVTAYNGSDSAYSTEKSIRSIADFTIDAVTPLTNTTMKVDWTTVAGAATYEVYYRIGTGSYTTATTALGAGVSTYTITGLAANTNYNVRVIAKNTVGVTTTVTAPDVAGKTTTAAPTGVSATASTGQIRIAWTNVTGASSYKILRGTVSGTLAVIEAAQASTPYDDTSVVAGTHYYYAVVANNGADSPRSSEVQGKTIAPFTVTSATAVSGTSIQVTWTAPAGADAHDILYRSTGATTTVSNKNPGDTITGLSPGVTYYISVKARNAVGSGTSYTTPEITEVTSVGPPSPVTISATPGQIRLNWSAVATALNYKVSRSTNAGGPYTEIDGNVTSMPWDDTTVADGTRYYYVVKTYNGSDSANSTEVSAKSIAAFTISSTTATASSVIVSWNGDAAVAGADSFKLEYKTSAGSTWTPVTPVTSPRTVSSLSANTSYDFRIVGSNTAGVTTTYTTPVVTQLTAPATITNLAATSTSASQVALDWSDVAGATSYKVFRKSGGAYDYNTPLATVASSSYLDTTAVAGTTYQYVVRSNNGTDSADSNEVTKKPIGTFNLTGVAGVAGSSTSLALTWDAATGADNYKVEYGATSTVYTGSVSPVTGTSYTLTALSPNTQYFIRITAQNSTGTAIPSNEMNSYTSTAAPTSLVATATTTTSGRITLTWTAASGATNYNVYRSTTSNTYNYASALATGVSSGYVDTSITEGTTYYYVVRANNGSESPSSTQASAQAIANFSIDTTASNAAGTQATITWTAPAGATSYDLLYRSTGSTTTVAATSPYNLGSLTPGETYYFRVKAKNSVGGVLTEVLTPEVSQKMAVAAPTGLAFTTSGNNVNLTWNAVTGADSYKVYRSTTSNTYGAALVTGLTGTSYSDSPTIDGSTYYYVVKSFNGTDSVNSSEISVKPIAAFTVATTVLSSTSIRLTFGPVTGATSNLYEINYGTSPGSYGTQLTSQSSPKDITGLSTGTTYYFQVIAKNSTTTRAASEVGASTAFGAPTGLVGVATPGTVDLTWNPVTGASEYRLYRRVGAGAYAQVGGSLTTESYQDTGLTDGTAYDYVVRAYNGTESANSNAVIIQPISSFTFSSATATSATQANLSWTDATGETSYDIYYGTSTGNYGAPINQTGTTKTLTGLSAGTTYFAKIVAKNNAGTAVTVNSSELSFTTAPATISDLAVTSPIAGRSRLTWSAPATATSYTILRGTSAGTHGTTVATGVTGTSYNDDHGNNGTTYYYVITSTNGVTSADSNEVFIQTVANFGATPTTTALSSTSIKVDWTAVTGAATYEVYMGTSSGNYGGSPVATVTAPTVTATISTGISAGNTYYFKVVAKNAVGATSSRDSSEVSQITPLAAPPITLSAVQTPGQVTISWTANGATNYRISRGTSTTSYDTFYTTTGSSYNDTGLTNGQTYYYTIQSYNGAYSGYATEKSIQPIAAFSVTSTSSTASTITPTWTAPLGAATVEVEYKTTASGTYTNAGAQASGYSIPGLTSGTTYDVRLVAKNTVGGVTTTYTTAAVQQVTAIGAPATVALASTDGTVGISWSSVTGATSYKIFRATSSNGYNYSSPIATINHPTLSTSDSPTRDGTTYYYVIRTFNGSDSVSSTEYSIKPIGAFTFSSATPISASRVDLSWTAAAGADSYDVYSKLTSGSYGAPTNVVGTSTSITGLTANSNYSFYVVAKNASGATLTSSTLTAQTATGAPTISSITSNETPTQAVLTWSAVTGATGGYKIYRGLSAGTLAWIADVADATAGTKTFTNTGLTSGTAYYYAIRTFNGTESADSNVVQVKPISAVTLSGANTQSDSSVALTWGAVSGEDTFDLYYGPVAQPTLFNIQDVAVANATTYTVTGLSAATQYSFSIRARNLQGTQVTTQTSNTLNATTSAAAPTISVSSVTPTTVNLSWTNGSFTYNVYRATAVGGPYSQVATGVTSIHPDAVTADGSTYFYKVRTYNGTESIDSNVVSAQPIENFSITSAVAYSTTEIDVTWPTVAGAVTYDVLYRLNATGAYTTLANKTSPFRIPSLTANSLYGIVVQAKNSVGATVSVNSAEVQARTSMVAPVLATATGGKSQVALTWTYSGTGTPTYKVYRSTTSGTSGMSLLAAGASVSGLSFTDSTAVAGTTYYYMVKANNGTSDSAFSNELFKQPMSAFTITSVTGGSASVIVNYPAVTGAESYDIQWGTTAALGTTITGANRPHTISGLTVGQTYYVRVVAKNTIGGGSSINSDADSSGTPNSPPVLGAIADQSTDAGTAIAVPFTLTDSNHVLTCAGAVTGSSSNTTTVPNANIVITGTVPNCTATITPASGQMGNLNITLTASDTVDTATRTFALNVIPCTVASITWNTQPANVTAGNTWASAPSVTLRKADNSVCTSNTAPVSLYVSIDTSTQQDADLNWISNSVTPVNGVATFTNAKLTRAGTAYTIAATQGGVNSLDSSTFNVTAGAASKIIWSVQPATTNRTSNIIPSPTIQTTDAYSNIVTSNIGNVTISLMDNTEGATLSGTLTRAVNGSAAFSGLSLNVVGSYYLRATPANGWAVADSNTFSIIQIVTQNTTSVMEMLAGSLVHTGQNTSYPGAGISWGTDYLDGTTTYTWQIVATNTDNQASTVRIRQGATNVTSVNVPSNTTAPTLFTTTISNASVPTNANWSLRVEKGTTVIYSSRVIVNQTGASRTQVWIPLTSMDNNSTATASASTASATMVVPTEQNFPPFEWDNAKIARVDSILLMATSRAGACVQLFNKDTNSAIGSEVCNTSGSDSIVSVAIDPTVMPSAALIEARMRSSTGAAAYVTKAGLLVRLVSIEKMLAIQRVAPTATLTATTNFVENRAYSTRGSYGTGTVSEYVKCRAKANTAGGGSFIYKNHTTNTSGTTGSSTITASTNSFSSQSSFTSLEAGPMSSTNGTYEYMNYTHTSGSFSLSHCLKETEVTY